MAGSSSTIAMRRDMAANIAEGAADEVPAPPVCQNSSLLCPACGRAVLAFGLLMPRMQHTMQEADRPGRPALPLLVLLAFASALGVGVAIALAGIAMLLAAPAYAGEGGLLLERGTATAEARRLFSESESVEHGSMVRTRVLEQFHNPFAERLAGIYLNRLPRDAVVESLRFTRMAEDAAGAPEMVPALFTLRGGGALVQHTAQIGPGELLLVELEYRAPATRRLLAAR